MSDEGPLDTQGCTIVVERLFKEVNEQRKFLNQPPIEYSAMASRCSLRFQIDYKIPLDFNQPKIVISETGLEQLEALINQQFGVYFEGRLMHLCEKKAKPARAVVSSPAEEAATVDEPNESVAPPAKAGFMSRIKGMFGSGAESTKESQQESSDAD